MEILGAIVTLISFATTVVVGGICLFKGIFFMTKALAHRNHNVTGKNYFISFNIHNSLWIADGLTEEGKSYRVKAAKNISIFLGLLLLTFFLNHIVGFDSVST